MKHLKFRLLIFIVLSNVTLSMGQKKQFDKILDKVTKHIDKNYFSDSIFSVRHSEYVTDNLNDFKKIVSIEYFPTLVWNLDYKFYNQKYGFNNSLFPGNSIGYVVNAKLYKKEESNNLGYPVPHRFSTSSQHKYVDISMRHSFLAKSIIENKKNREINERNAKKPENNHFDLPDNNIQNKKTPISAIFKNEESDIPSVISIESPPIYTMTRDTVDYVVEEFLYKGIPCYKLSRITKTTIAYTDIDRQRLEKSLDDWDSEFIFSKYKYTEQEKQQQKNEFKQLVEYWANGKMISSLNYIISKNDFAVLFYSSETKQQNSNGQWFDIEKTREEYEKSQRKKYYQIYYSKLVRNYRGGFPNINNYHTLIIRTPINTVFSLDNVKKISRSIYLEYENFCEKIDTLNQEILSDWDSFFRTVYVAKDTVN